MSSDDRLQKMPIIFETVPKKKFTDELSPLTIQFFII